MVAIAEPRATPKADRFYRPSRDGAVFCFISQSGSCRAAAAHARQLKVASETEGAHDFW
jgi:hypothetical protein